MQDEKACKYLYLTCVYSIMYVLYWPCITGDTTQTSMPYCLHFGRQIKPRLCTLGIEVGVSNILWLRTILNAYLGELFLSVACLRLAKSFTHENLMSCEWLQQRQRSRKTMSLVSRDGSDDESEVRHLYILNVNEEPSKSDLGRGLSENKSDNANAQNDLWTREHSMLHLENALSQFIWYWYMCEVVVKEYILVPYFQSCDVRVLQITSFTCFANEMNWILFSVLAADVRCV